MLLFPSSSRMFGFFGAVCVSYATAAFLPCLLSPCSHPPSPLGTALCTHPAWHGQQGQDQSQSLPLGNLAHIPTSPLGHR